MWSVYTELVEVLPSPTINRKLIPILENREYMAMLREELAEIKQFLISRELSSNIKMKAARKSETAFGAVKLTDLTVS